MFAPAEQLYREVMLLNRSGLANGRAIESHKQGALGGITRQKSFARDQQLPNPLRQPEEMFLHYAPPNTCTDEKSPGGVACPTRIAWFGSPLPQVGVPSTRTVSEFPSAFRLRQKLADTPR